MIAPVYTQNADGRYVYLPEDMLMIRFRSASDYDLIPLEKGDHYVELPLGAFPLFVKKNHAVLLGRGAEHTDELEQERFTVLGRIGRETEYLLYRDDGRCVSPELAEHLTRIPLGPQEERSEIVCPLK